MAKRPSKSSTPGRTKAEPKAEVARADKGETVEIGKAGEVGEPRATKAEPAPAPTDPRDAKFEAIGADAVRENIASGRYTDVRRDRAEAWLARQ